MTEQNETPAEQPSTGAPGASSEELVSNLSLIESQPLTQRAEAYEQLYRQLAQQLD